jgi:iron complex transport system substrate-binding protein
VRFTLGSVRLSRVISAVAALVLASAPALAGAPQRVVSVNLCTDQLALMLAAPGQVISVTKLAAVPRVSTMAAQAADIPANSGLAEEIYMMQPDLVVAGRFTDRATLDMLRRLGVPVEVFSPAYALQDVPQRVSQMGQALGRVAQAEALVQRFEADLAALSTPGPRPRAALYYANGYTSGDGSLAGQILRAGGFDNIAQELGAIGALPLEVLAMANPDVVVTGQPYPGASRAEAIMQHPVVAQLKRQYTSGTMTDRDWVCGTPYVLRAIADMRALRAQLEAQR